MIIKSKVNMPIQEIKNKIKVIGEKYDLKSVFLFGSMSRGTNKTDSDIDLHIYSKEPISLIKHSNILADCKELFNKEVDLIVNGEYDDAFMNNIKNDEILIYGE